MTDAAELRARGIDPSVPGHPMTCEKCSQHVIAGREPDPCLGVLPGVAWACCGHGDDDSAYVVLGGRPCQTSTTIENGVVLRGADALAFFAAVGRSEERWTSRAAYREILDAETRAELDAEYPGWDAA